MSDEPDHSSRKATEARNYEQLRNAGVTPDHARRTAEKSSAYAHAAQDRLNSDKNPRKRGE
jgi:hypothetical protein